MYAQLFEHLRADARAAAPRCATSTRAARRSTRRSSAGGGALGLELHNGYGLTEASPTVSQTRLEAPRADAPSARRSPAWKSASSTRRRCDVHAGAVGELWVRGPNVMRGYFRDAASDRARDRRGGLAQHGRPRARRTRTAPVHRRPQQGPHHPLRLQRLSGRSRGGAERASRRCPVRGGRTTVRRRQRRGRGIRRARRRSRRRTRECSPRTPRRSSRPTSGRARSASWPRCPPRRQARSCAASSRRWPPRS